MKKMGLILYNIYKFSSMFKLQRSYDNNELSNAIFEISAKIRNRHVNKISVVFEEKLCELLAKPRERTTVPSAARTTVSRKLCQVGLIGTFRFFDLLARYLSQSEAKPENRLARLGSAKVNSALPHNSHRHHLVTPL